MRFLDFIKSFLFSLIFSWQLYNGFLVFLWVFLMFSCPWLWIVRCVFISILIVRFSFLQFHSREHVACTAMYTAFKLVRSRSSYSAARHDERQHRAAGEACSGRALKSCCNAWVRHLSWGARGIECQDLKHSYRKQVVGDAYCVHLNLDCSIFVLAFSILNVIF